MATLDATARRPTSRTPTIAIDATWSFKSFRLDDARARLDSGVDMAGKVAEGTIIAGSSEGAAEVDIAGSAQ